MRPDCPVQPPAHLRSSSNPFTTPSTRPIPGTTTATLAVVSNVAEAWALWFSLSWIAGAVSRVSEIRACFLWIRGRG